jgi:hypothetical protein
MRIDWRGERGQVGGIEVLPFGVLVFVAGTLLVASGWSVLDVKGALGAAAREAARAYVEASPGTGAAAEADAAAREAIAGHGRDPARLDIEILAEPAYRRCGRVEVTARYRLPVLAAPWLGSVGPSSVVRASHIEIIDPFRRGIGGVARCG